MSYIGPRDGFLGQLGNPSLIPREPLAGLSAGRNQLKAISSQAGRGDKGMSAGVGSRPSGHLGSPFLPTSRGSRVQFRASDFLGPLHPPGKV